MKISFYGAAKVVTGSCFLLESEDNKILIDCGMFQGSRSLSEMNDMDFPFRVEDVNCLILTHAHIDHSGRIPKLVKDGFTGKIYCTNPTKSLCEIMLADSAHIQKSEAEQRNRKNRRKGIALVEPMYTQEDVDASMKLFEAVDYSVKFEINDKISFTFANSGHMLGSAFVKLFIKEGGEEKTILFTGDIGNHDKPILPNPEIVEGAQYLVCESTYGGRLHDEQKEKNELLEIILSTAKENGTVVIPAFAVGRTQEILYEINKYKENDMLGEFSDIRVFVDSPLAIRATEIFKQYYKVFDAESRKLIDEGDDPLVFDNLEFSITTEESKAINFDEDRKVVISASGMCDSGRILHHLKHNLWQEKNSIVFVGYQSTNSLGRQLLDGREHIKLFGEEIAVKANIYNIEGFSGHGDQAGIISWIEAFKEKPIKVVLVHGEEDQIEALKNKIGEKIKVEKIAAPALGESIDLDTFKTTTEDTVYFKGFEEKAEKESAKKEKTQTEMIIDFINDNKSSLNNLSEDKIKQIFHEISDTLK